MVFPPAVSCFLLSPSLDGVAVVCVSRSGLFCALALLQVRSFADLMLPSISQWLALRLAIAFLCSLRPNGKEICNTVVGSPLGHCVFKTNGFQKTSASFTVVGSPLGHCVFAKEHLSLIRQWDTVVGSPLGHCVFEKEGRNFEDVWEHSGWLSAWPLRF